MKASKYLLSESWVMLEKKTCWSKCNDCKKKWKEIDMEYVAMILVGAKTFFICENCMEEGEYEVIKL